MIPVENSVPSRYPALVTFGLIGINVLVFLYEASLPAAAERAFIYGWGLVPARYASPAWALRAGLSPNDYWPFLTNVFLHAGWLHLIANMWTLWLFGRAVEDRMGGFRYLAFYLACGIAASGLHAWVNPFSTIPALGASGAVSGVLGAYVRLFPRSWIIVLVPILFIPFFFELPAVLYVALWFAMQLIEGSIYAVMPNAGGVAWWAHIGGFLAGLALAPLLYRPRRSYRPYYADEGFMGFGPWGQR